MDRLEIYKQLLSSIPTDSDAYQLINVCVTRYEVNVNNYFTTRNEHYKTVALALANILNQFIET